MAMMIVTVLLMLITVVCVRSHLKASGSVQSAAPKPSGPPCPRCGVPAPAEATFCPGCGVPRQIYEVVAAPISRVAAEGEDAGLQHHAVIRADICVGCATCVPVCPEAGAIRLEGKLAVVDKQLCLGHGKCAEACPVGGILMTTGDAVHQVEVPEVDARFATNVDGIYLVGELGGRGLIKNAINEGKLAVESIAEELFKEEESGPENSSGETLDVVIVGSGPAGLSAGLEAHRRGMKYIVLEQGDLADTIRRYPRHKVLFAEPIKIPLYGDLWVADSSKETLIEIWETIIANTGLKVLTQRRVENIKREGSEILVRAGDETYSSHKVVLALGRRGTPRRLGVAGEDLEKVFYDVVEMEAFRDRKVLVVGGGDSAIESALGIANQEGTAVHLSYRGSEFKRVKDRNREKLDRAVSDGKIEILLNSELAAIESESVRIQVDGEERTMPNDNVIIRIGGEPPFPFLERIGVRMIKKDVPLPESSLATV